MKDDERALMLLVAERHGGPYRPADAPFIDALGEEIGMHPKRACGIAEKWTSKGWWDSGVTTRSGWLTPEGFQHAQGLKTGAPS